MDKTDLIYELVKQGVYFFLSRPRCFGKNLLLSTIDAFFSGKRDLIKGLAIDKLVKDWEEYPVLHLDLNNREFSEYESLIKELSANLEKWEAILNRWMSISGLHCSPEWPASAKSLFLSDLNNLRDISFEPGFSAICGITSEEIDKYFGVGVCCLSDALALIFLGKGDRG